MCSYFVRLFACVCDVCKEKPQETHKIKSLQTGTCKTQNKGNEILNKQTNKQTNQRLSKEHKDTNPNSIQQRQIGNATSIYKTYRIKTNTQLESHTRTSHVTNNKLDMNEKLKLSHKYEKHTRNTNPCVFNLLRPPAAAMT